MTDTTADDVTAETPHTPTDGVQEQEVTDTPNEQEQPHDEDPRGNREAAKYRRQARDAEAARDTLAAQLTAARAQIVKASFIGHHSGLTVEALEAGGHPVDSLFTADGSLDVAALNTAGREVADRFGLVQRMIIPSEGRSPSGNIASDDFHAAFAPKA